MQAVCRGSAYVVSSLTGALHACRLSHRQGAASAARPSSRGASVRTYSLLGGLFGSKGDMGAAGSKAPGAREGWSPAAGEAPCIMAVSSSLRVSWCNQAYRSWIVWLKLQSVAAPLGQSRKQARRLRCITCLRPIRTWCYCTTSPHDVLG